MTYKLPLVAWIAVTSAFGQAGPGPVVSSSRAGIRVSSANARDHIFSAHIVLLDERHLLEWVRVTSTCGFASRSADYRFYLRNTVFDSKPSQLCFADVSVPGYRSQRLAFADNMEFRLNPLKAGEGSTLSLTSTSAPLAARQNYQKGVSHHSDKEENEAWKSWQKAVEIDPRFAEAWNKLGEHFEEARDLAEAERAYRTAAEADKDFIEPHVRLANLALSQSKWERALEESERAIAMNTVEFPMSYVYHALAAVNLEQWEKAEHSATTMIALDSNHAFPLAEYALAVTLDHKGDRESALLHFKRYLSLIPETSPSSAVRRRVAALEAGMKAQ